MLDYRHCTLCPRRCGVNRTAGQLGFCRMPDRIRAARAALHYWEEPVISGSFGSGAVFFSGCTLQCAFCQNGVISQENFGKELSSAQLREAFERLIDEGCQNINLVTPTHFLPSILPALTPKLPVPVVYNCGGYESVEALQALDGLIDIYLTDFKYMDSSLAKVYSRAEDYPETAKRALAEMVRQTGEAVFDENGLMKKGVIVRHLLLPGAVKNAKAVVKYVYETYGDTVWLSLMSQYTPLPQVENISPLNRKTTKREYERLLDYTFSLGVTNAFLQEGPVAEESFIPEFDERGI